MLWNRKSSEFELNCGQPIGCPQLLLIASMLIPSFYQFGFVFADPVQFLTAAVAVFLIFAVNGDLAPGTIVDIVIAVSFKLRPVQYFFPDLHRCLIRQ